MTFGDLNTIQSMVKYTGDNADEILCSNCLTNANNTVKSRLKKYNLTIPSNDNILDTAVNYYAISDILQSLYQGTDERSDNEKGYYEKAEALICDYITQQLKDPNSTYNLSRSVYRVSHSPLKWHK